MKVLPFALFFMVSFSAFVYAESRIPAAGDRFPEISLETPADPAQKQYLGIEGKEFTLKDIKADILIIEVFSMYCPYCQKEAPVVNKLYEMIREPREDQDKIKIIGIGAGNTPFEVDLFRKEYSVEFPLFPDESFSLHKAIGEVRTPYFFVLRLTGKDKGKIIYSRLGKLDDPQQFLEKTLKAADMGQEVR
jgi:thiol-disulfide isomerase/thioredoxin